jgi:hypothetical protein
MILEKIIFEFSQEANCLSSDDEELEITYISDLGLGRDKQGFFILNTAKWSVDKDELESIFTKIIKATEHLIQDGEHLRGLRNENT